jgi:DNA-directed RNA polymerase alpha subunit
VIERFGAAESVPVMSLGLWPGTIGSLESAGPATAGEVARRSAAELLRVDGLDEYAVQEISDRLDDFGLALRRNTHSP